MSYLALSQLWSNISQALLLRIFLIEIDIVMHIQYNPNHCIVCWNICLLVCSLNLCLNIIICLASLFFLSSMVGFIHYFCVRWTTTRWLVLRIINEAMIVPKSVFVFPLFLSNRTICLFRSFIQTGIQMKRYYFQRYLL